MKPETGPKASTKSGEILNALAPEDLGLFPAIGLLSILNT
jgi:hypothetical protein